MTDTSLSKWWTESSAQPSTTRSDQKDDAAIAFLDDPRALDTRLVGAKAANLARARQHNLPVLDGFVITTIGTSLLDSTDRLRCLEIETPLRKAWRAISVNGTRPLAVRSSSVVEDSTTSSMAGRFVSVLHVTGWEEFVVALGEVIASAASTELGDAPMAVLVQPMAAARLGGVMFGLDPLTGDRSSILVSAVEGLPDQIVSGAVTGTSLVLSRRGRLRSVTGPVPAQLRAGDRRALARLARQAEKVFGARQDVEWLIEPDGTLRLLQSRPITASAVPPAKSHPLGPGPVAETFPDPLSLLERDLWEPPLQDGIREALRISGAVSSRALRERFVVDIGGRVAVDLQALGVVVPRQGFLGRLDPRGPARHLRAAFRIGRLRAAMPAIAHDLVTEIDAHLAAVPSLVSLGDYQLLTILANSRATLAALQAHEVLAGFFLDQRTTSTTSASVALTTLARARADGLTDAEIVERHPVVLALLPPRIGQHASPERFLPPTPAALALSSGAADSPLALARESLRLRVRWVHELTARVAMELGTRLARRGQLDDADQVRDLRFEQLRALIDAPGATITPAPPAPTAPPLPAMFRLTVAGTVVADTSPAAGGTIGVSAGRAQAAVTHDPAAARGAILVVRSLDPALASVLPDVAGLVSETGSPLSHLAILAREYGVPTVVGIRDATATLAEGAVVLIDGAAGTVEVVDAGDEASAPKSLITADAGSSAGTNTGGAR